MLQHITPHFAANNNNTTTNSPSSTDSNKSTSSGEESPGAASHERSPSPTERHQQEARTSPSAENDGPESRSPTPMVQSDQESCDESSEHTVEPQPQQFEARRRLPTAAMKKEMDTSPVRLVRTRSEIDEDVEDFQEDEEEDEDRSRPHSRCDDSPPPPEILTNRVSISQRLSDKYSGSIIRRALKPEEGRRDPVVVLNHQRLLMGRMKTESPVQMVEEEDTDSNVPLDLSLNAEEKMQREQTEMYMRQHKNKDDAGTESDDSGGPGEDRGRAYKKSLMKRYCEY